MSKIKHIFLPNAARGTHVGVFALLDNNVSDVKQTFWRTDYSTNPFVHMNRQDLKAYIDKYVRMAGFNDDDIRVRTLFMPPPQRNFSTNDGVIPVTDKSGPNHLYNDTVALEPATVRFQNNMRWMSGLRQCVKWVQDTEYQQKWFYDVVVRLRDDSYAFGNWILDQETYRQSFVSADLMMSFGLNDRTFTVDRYWADKILRGIVEDYYFNETLDGYAWTNPERR
jgi:hypothetical protein